MLIHARVAAIRAHEIHKATTDLATRHEVIAIEQLSAKNMARRGGRRKRGLNRALGDAAVGRIGTQLGYKTTWYGTELVTAPRFFPSTQLCSQCGAKTKLRRRDRSYRCRDGCPPIDRDVNAAINLARLGDPTHGGGTRTGTGSRPPALRLEMDVEPPISPAPSLPWVRWGRQEAMKRQPRTVRGPLLRKEKLPEMLSHTNTHVLGKG
jgi:putative transposase